MVRWIFQFYASINWGLVLLGACTVSFIVTLLLGPKALAQQDLVCRKDNVSRHLAILVENPDTGLPCSLIDKTDQNNPEVLWRAEYERAFCREKMRELLDLLLGQGWICRLGRDRSGRQPVM